MNFVKFIYSSLALCFLMSQAGCVASKDDINNLENKIDKMDRTDSELKTKRNDLPEQLCLFQVIESVDMIVYPDESSVDFEGKTRCPEGSIPKEWTFSDGAKYCEHPSKRIAAKFQCSGKLSYNISNEDRLTIESAIRVILSEDETAACYLPCDMVQ